jgi:type I restriction enzyme M protein
MLKPGGRAAIVLPQGKFNNSSLAFIREWILRKARLLAVVGLHPNTFKPHTGTKTSVLFVQRYTQEQLASIAKAQQEVAGACPDYETQVKDLIAKYKDDADVPEDAIPGPIADLTTEMFSEPEPEMTEESLENGEEEKGSVVEESVALETRIAQAEERVNDLKTTLLKAKQRLMNLQSDFQAMEEKHEQEIDLLMKGWEGTKKELQACVKEAQASYLTVIKRLKADQTPQQKAIKEEIKRIEKEIPEAEYQLKLLSNRGKLEVILVDSDLIGNLKERWIATEVAKRLDYPIFMRNVSMKMRHFQQIFSVPPHRSQAMAC